MLLLKIAISFSLCIAGSLKAGRDENMLKVFMIRPVKSTPEIHAHLLEMAILPVR